MHTGNHTWMDGWMFVGNFFLKRINQDSAADSGSGMNSDDIFCNGDLIYLNISKPRELGWAGNLNRYSNIQ